MIIVVGELFFRANGLKAGLHMFVSIFTDFRPEKLWDSTFLNLGCAVVGIVGVVKEHNLWKEENTKRFCAPIRWAACYGLLLAVIIFGAYGIGYQQVDLIYAGF